MASAKVEREVDDFVEQCPLKRSTMVNRYNAINNKAEYDAKWKEMLRRIDEDKAINCFM